MGDGGREGGKRVSQGGGKQEKGKNYATLHNILQSKKCEEVGVSNPPAPPHPPPAGGVKYVTVTQDKSPWLCR